MNKRIFTLVVGVLALLTCSLPVKAQTLGGNSTYDVSPIVKAAFQPKPGETPIPVIDPAKWYEIKVYVSTPQAENEQPTYLTMERDVNTGELYVCGRAKIGTMLNQSLWKISAKHEGPAGYVYTLTNKATGYVLSFNDNNIKATSRELPQSSDVNEWQWYSDPTQIVNLGQVPFYAYNHDGSKIFGFESVNDGSNNGILKIKSVDKANFQDRDGAGLFLRMRIVEAAPRVLRADEFNSMIDASNGGSAILKSIPTVANELFGQKVKAEPVAPAALGTAYKGFANFLSNEDGNYFMVATDSTYDYVTLPTSNGGFKVGFAPLKGIKEGAAIDTTVAKVTSTADALIARYLWRITYYPTPDSLVLEPLNASSVSKYDKQMGTIWLKSNQPKATQAQFFNTVNQSVAAADGRASDPTQFESVYFNKDANAVVALTIYNEGKGSYDQSSVLTVGCALNAPITYSELTEVTAIPGAKYNNTDDVTAQMGIRIYFDSKYNYLTRATLPTGLYFIQLASTSNNDLFRKAGKYYVDNHRGTTMFDSPTSYQNYVHMPATQWIVYQDSCHVNGGTPEVVIANREYATNSPWDFFFRGQLYKDNNGNFFTINKDYNGQVDNAGMLYARSPYGTGLNYMDTLKITLITDPIAYSSHNGYQYIDSLNTMYNEYNLKYLTANLYGNTTTDQYLSLANDSVLGINATPNLAFQLVKVFNENNLNEYGSINSNMLKNIPWRFVSSVDTIRPLQRQAYILKVRDNNLIDNGWKYVAFHQDVVNQNPYYKMENLKNMDGQINKLAVFYLKNDQFTADSTDAFALIDLVGLQKEVMTQSEEYPEYTKEPITTDFTNATSESLIEEANALVKLLNPEDRMGMLILKSQLRDGGVTRVPVGENPFADYKMYKDNGWYRLAVEDQNAMSTIATLDNEPNTRVSAFVLAPVAREIYMPLTDKGVLAGNNIKIYRERGINGATKEYLYEDGNNAANVAETSYIKGFNYLGITGENIAPVGKDKTVAFYVDSVLHSQKVMPQYLLYVDRDTIAEGKWCNTGEHGYDNGGDSKTHQIKYNALSYGRVLVNLNDSVSSYNGTSINMLENGKKYAFENYTRLGFVPAIHISIAANKADSASAFAFLKPGEWLIVLNNTTFKDLMSTVSTNVIDPVKLDSALAQGKAQKNILNGAHQNYAFSFRYTDDAHENFLMESRQWEGVKEHFGYPGTFNTASWVKIQNNVPVLAQSHNPLNGDHTEIAGYNRLSEVINQAQIFKLKTTDEIATANENLTAASVQVFAGNGVVTVKNAAGKKLVITNILGKVIANTVVTSDNATFAAPAGIVAVAVEGEPAVKAIVK